MTTINELLPSNTSSAVAAGVGNDELGQAEFLELMVAQLANQDPTNPTDSSQFFSQIAEFSVVEGVNSMSESFNEFTSLYSGSQALNAVNLVGRDVMTNSNVAYVNEQGAVSATLALPSSASSVEVYIQNEDGVVLKQIDLGETPSGQQLFEWDGTNEDGDRVAEGNYWINAYAEFGGQTQGISVFAHNRVDSVLIDSSSSGYQLMLNGGSTVESAEIMRIFQ